MVSDGSQAQGEARFPDRWPRDRGVRRDIASEPIQTSTFWNAAVTDYVAAAEPFTALFCADAVALADVTPGLALLDIATGPGAAAIAAANAGAIVTAIDFSAAMIEQVKARAGRLPISALQMDGQALDLPDASFDRACSVFGIPLFRDWRAGLREMARVLKPGGRAVVATADNPHGFGPNPLLARARARLFGDQPAPGATVALDILSDRNRLVAAFEACGLASVEIHERTHPFVLDPALMAEDHPMLVENPVLAGLSADARVAVIRAAVAEALGHASAGRLTLPGTARFIVARKP